MNSTTKTNTFNAMQNRLVVELCPNNLLEICYHPKTDRTLFDICDLNGRIIKTGGISANITRVDISGLHQTTQYILLILDGDQLCSKKFSLQG